MSETIITTKEQITKVFGEWHKRYNENPDDFLPIGYEDGDAEKSADYFLELLHKVN